jgi:hypothetical protein
MITTINFTSIEKAGSASGSLTTYIGSLANY